MNVLTIYFNRLYQLFDPSTLVIGTNFQKSGLCRTASKHKRGSCQFCTNELHNHKPCECDVRISFFIFLWMTTLLRDEKKRLSWYVYIVFNTCLLSYYWSRVYHLSFRYFRIIFELINFMTLKHYYIAFKIQKKKSQSFTFVGLF